MPRSGAVVVTHAFFPLSPLLSSTTPKTTHPPCYPGSRRSRVSPAFATRMAQNPIHDCGDPLTPPRTQALSASQQLANRDRQPNPHKCTPIARPAQPRPGIARTKPLYVSFISPATEVQREDAESTHSPSSARRKPKNRQNPSLRILRRSSEHQAPAATACALVTVSASQSAFSKLNTRPPMPPFTLHVPPYVGTRKTRGQYGIAISFPVRLFHSQLRAGLSFSRTRITHTNHSHLSGFGFVSLRRTPSLLRCGGACVTYTQAHPHASNVKSDQRSHR